MTDEVRIQHIFRDKSGFCDAIVLPREEYEALSVEDIDAMKAERVQAHAARLAEVQARPVPSEEELRAAKEAELAELEARVAALSAEVGREVVKGGR